MVKRSIQTLPVSVVNNPAWEAFLTLVLKIQGPLISLFFASSFSTVFSEAVRKISGKISCNIKRNNVHGDIEEKLFFLIILHIRSAAPVKLKVK